MAKVIIGIHGRSNKPAKPTLETGWKSAITEGLVKNQGAPANVTFDFELAYYSDLFYPAPLPDSEYLYTPAAQGSLKPYEPNLIQKARGWLRDFGDDRLDGIQRRFSSCVSPTARRVFREFFADFHTYLNDQAAGDNTRARLRDLLLPHAADEVLLIAHSMGCIVSYDLLRMQEQTPNPIPVKYFTTIGSPLGMSPIEHENEERFQTLRTPEGVTGAWSNFSEIDDYVSFDLRVRDDYGPNAAGLMVTDTLIANDWPGNAHKSYGYLRSPEVSELIANFLQLP